MDQFNVNGAKKVSKNESVKPTEKRQNTPYIPAMHQEKKDSVSFSGGNKPASAQKASNAFLSRIASLMQGLEGQTLGSIINKMTELNKKVEGSINALKQSKIDKAPEATQKNIDDFIQVYFESFVINSEVAAETVLQGGLKDILKEDKTLSIELLTELYNKKNINSDKKESKAVYTLISKISQLSDEEVNKNVKNCANFYANSIDLGLTIKDENKNYNDILQSVIKVCKTDYESQELRIKNVLLRIKKLIKNQEKGTKLLDTISQYVKSNQNSNDAAICKQIVQKISNLDENKVNGIVKDKAINLLKEIETQNKLASLDTALNVEPFDKNNVISTIFDIVKKDPNMVNDVVSKISSFSISKDNNNTAISLMNGLYTNITQKATPDGLKNLELILKAFINLPKENTNAGIEGRANVLLKKLNLFNLINNKNSNIEDILNAGIDYMKYKHPGVIFVKSGVDFIPLLKDDEKGPLFIQALYNKAIDKESADSFIAADLLDEMIYIEKSENNKNILRAACNAYYNGDDSFTLSNDQEEIPQEISTKIMNAEEGCHYVKDLAEKSLKNDKKASNILKQISLLPDNKVPKAVKDYALACSQMVIIDEEFKKGKDCNMSRVVDNALSLSYISDKWINYVDNKLYTFILNNNKNDANKDLNNKLIDTLFEKAKDISQINKAEKALSFLSKLEKKPDVDIGQSLKEQIKKHSAIANLYILANKPNTKMEEIADNILNAQAVFKEYGQSPLKIVLSVENILVDVNKGNELIKILFEKAKSKNQSVYSVLFAMQCYPPGKINKNVKQSINNAIHAISVGKGTFEISQANINGPQKPIANPNNANGNTIQSGHSIFSTPQTEEYKKMIEAKIATFEPKKGQNGEDLKQILYIDGKAMEFECYVDTKMKYSGSNGGYFVYNPDTHDLCWFKAGNEQSQAEAVASELYSLADIPVAEMKLCKDGPDEKGKACILSKYLFLDKDPSSYDEKKKLNHGFGMDVLLANWDAVISSNAQMSGEQVYRVDFGGTFNYRAQGEPAYNKFISIPDEITSMLNPEYTSYKMFETLTREDLIDSLKSVCNINDHDMAIVLQKSHLKMYTNTLLKRKQFLKEMLNRIENTPKKDNVSMYDYLTDIKHVLIEEHIMNASKASEITDLQMAIKKITIEPVKQKLQEALNAKKTQILASQQPVPKQITMEQLQNLLTGTIYIKTQDGKYKIDETKAEYKDYIQAINTHCEKYSKKVKSLLSSSIDTQQLTNMVDMLNYNNGEFIDIFTKDIKSFVIFYNAVMNSFGMIGEDDEIAKKQWGALVNSFIHPANKDELAAVKYYKGNEYKQINGALTQQKQDPGYVTKPEIQKYIDDLTSYIQTQEVPNDMTVFRGEGLQVLNSAGNVTVNFKDGSSITKPLGDLLKEAMIYSPEKRNELIDSLLENDFEATQERFMSVAAKNPFGGDLQWELTVPAGSHALYLEVPNVDHVNDNEKEFLLQRDSQIAFKGVSFANGKWTIHGTINTP